MKLLLFLAASALALAADPAQKVIDDYLKAQGGAKALAQLRTETITGNLSDESGKTGSYSLITKAPNQFYSEILIEPNRTVEAYNGMSAWGQRS
jgi:hypothetical protein